MTGFLGQISLNFTNWSTFRYSDKNLWIKSEYLLLSNIDKYYSLFIFMSITKKKVKIKFFGGEKPTIDKLSLAMFL